MVRRGHGGGQRRRLAPDLGDGVRLPVASHAQGTEGDKAEAGVRCRHHWRAGNLAFWANRATQHLVVPDFAGQHRVIQRITIRGYRPY